MDISFKYYGTHQRWRDIRDANDCDPNELTVGQVLQVPDLDTGSVVAAVDHGQPRNDGKGYVVRKGDSYYTIARDVLGDASRYEELVALNTIAAYDLMPGDVIALPEGSPRRSTTPAQVPRAERQLPAGARYHVVQSGDYLGAISLQYYGTSKKYRAIMEANNISDPRELKVDQKLIIPNAGGSASSALGSSSHNSTSSLPPNDAGEWYVVQSGDTLTEIAKRHYGDEQDYRKIMTANSGINPRSLIVGKKLWLPKEAGSRAASSNTSTGGSGNVWRSATTTSGTTSSGTTSDPFFSRP